MSNPQSHLPSLDGYRGLAMWMVVAYHMVHAPGFGWVAIQMFFVLSGFLITRMLLVEEHLPLGESLKLFYWRRALRIMPALYLYLLIVLVLSYLSAELATARPMLPWAALYVHNLAWIAGADAGISPAGIMATQHLWSLSVEEHFYLIWPLLFLVAPARYRLWLIGAMLILAPCVRLLIQLQWPDHASDRPYAAVVYAFSASHLDAFAFGAVVTLMLQRCGPIFSSLRLFLALCGVAAVAGLIASGAAFPTTFKELRQHSLGYPLHMHAGGLAVWGYTVVNLLCAALLIVAIRNTHARRWLSHRFLRWSGKISYSMYLIHQPILYVFQQLQPQFASVLGSSAAAKMIVYPAYLLLIFIIASLSFRYFETYFIRLKPAHKASHSASATQISASEPSSGQSRLAGADHDVPDSTGRVALSPRMRS